MTVPYLLLERLGLDVSAYAIVQSCVAIGSVLGAIWLGRRAGLHRRGLVWYRGDDTGSAYLFEGEWSLTRKGEVKKV